ncbi:MAG: glycosyltransferase [Flavobacteriaceae bacterium]|nr:glycosyltransferase [Flavobacteriaceae bacterium]
MIYNLKNNTIKNIKVLQLIDSLQVGGAEMMAVNIANALHRKGVNTHLIASRHEGSLKEKLLPEVGYLFLNRKKFIDIIAFLKLHQYIKNHKINIIHAHATSWFLAVVMKLRNPSLKIVWHDHFGNSEKLNQRNNLPLKIGSYFFESVISVNNKLHYWAVSKLNASTYFYVPNFVTPLLNQSNKTIDSLKGEDEKRIVCLANLRPQKDHLNLLEAFKIVYYKFPDWTLHLIGLKSDDLYYQQLQDFIDRNNLKTNVFIYENCSNGAVLLTQANIGVLASQSEGLPLALLEYGMAKLGVVVTDVGECGEVIDNDKNGCLVPASNSQMLAEKIVFLISHEKERSQMGENLNQKIKTNYSEEKVINQILDIYLQIE